MKRPNALDWLVYRVFRWWWNPILARCPNLTFGLMHEIWRRSTAIMLPPAQAGTMFDRAFRDGYSAATRGEEPTGNPYPLSGAHLEINAANLLHHKWWWGYVSAKYNSGVESPMARPGGRTGDVS